MPSSPKGKKSLNPLTQCLLAFDFWSLLNSKWNRDQAHPNASFKFTAQCSHTERRMRHLKSGQFICGLKLMNNT